MLQHFTDATCVCKSKINNRRFVKTELDQFQDDNNSIQDNNYICIPMISITHVKYNRLNASSFENSNSITRKMSWCCNQFRLLILIIIGVYLVRDD